MSNNQRAERELRQIKSAMAKGADMEKDDVWYLIDYQWYVKWKEFVHFDDRKNGVASNSSTESSEIESDNERRSPNGTIEDFREPPPPINNEKLLFNDLNTSGDADVSGDIVSNDLP